MSEFKKVYCLDVSVTRKNGVYMNNLLDWQNEGLRKLYRQASFSKTYDTFDAANKAMMDVKNTEPPTHGEWVTTLREQFAFCDPSQPNQWHVLSTQPCEILEQLEQQSSFP